MGFLNAYLHTEIPKKDKDEQVVMKIRVKLVRWLVKLETLARKHGDGKRWKSSIPTGAESHI